MKEKVFVFEAKRQELTAGLSDAVARVSALGEVVKAVLPRVSFGVPFLWALMDCERARPFYPLRQLLTDEILNQSAKESGLKCGPGWSERVRGYEVVSPHPLLDNLSDDVRLNRKFVELQCRKEAGVLRSFKIDEAYLRAGVIVIDKNGNVKPAKDAAARLEDFCTLYAETEEQAAFVACVERMQRAALDLEQAYKDTCASLPAEGAHRAALEACTWDYDPDQFGLTPSAAGTIRLTDQDAAARALISYFDRNQDTAPKFYNRACVLPIGPAELYEITGGLAGDKEAPKAGQEKPARTKRMNVCPPIIKED